MTGHPATSARYRVLRGTACADCGMRLIKHKCANGCSKQQLKEKRDAAMKPPNLRPRRVAFLIK